MGNKHQQLVSLMQDSAVDLQKIERRWWSLRRSRDEKERGKQMLWNSLILVIVIGSLAAMRWFGLSFAGIYSSLGLMDILSIVQS